MNGYDIKLINNISNITNIPIIASGGASCVNDFKEVIKCNASAAAGSFFVYHGPHKAVLISYLSNDELNSIY